MDDPREKRRGMSRFTDDEDQLPPKLKIRRENESGSSVDSRRRTPPEPSTDPGEGCSRSNYAANSSTSIGKDSGGDRQRQGDNRIRNKYEIVHTRPKSVTSKCGDIGDKIDLQTNYFRLSKRPEWNIYQYHVNFEPDIEVMRVKSGILSQHKTMLGGFLYWGNELYLVCKLRDESLILNAKSREGTEYKITIKYTGIISSVEWRSLQILNIILRRAMQGLKLQLVGRDFYDARAKINIQRHNLQLWPGYITSIKQHERDILVCAEVTTKVMRMETVYEMMNKCISEARNGDWQNLFKNYILGKTVLTEYNNTTYRIDDVNFSFKAENTFNKKGTEISFIQYYYEKYKIRIRDPQQPLLVSKSKDKNRRSGQDNIVLLIPELCRLTGLSDEMRKNFQLMKELAGYTKSSPQTRINKLYEFNRRLQETVDSQQTFKEWNMKLDSELVKVTGRVLPLQKIIFADNKKITGDVDADWTKTLNQNAQMFNAVSLKYWILIVPNRSLRQAQAFIDTLMKAAGKIGMQIRRPLQEIALPDDRSHSYDSALNRAANEDPQLILCVVPNDSVDRYNTIKKFCVTRRGIPSQVIQFKNIQKNSWPVAAKIAIQLNAKLGGLPWMINVPMDRLMVIGYDICRTSNKSKAYGAMVAAIFIDAKIRKHSYYSSVVECSPHDNLAAHLKLQLTAAIRDYQNAYKELPKRILFYRDSVGDGSLKQVYELEVKELVDFFKITYQNSPHQLKFSFFIVSKRINTKFFQRNNSNPVPGTVVDDVVTSPERYDFYIVSQSVRQGCASPTSYNVLYDNSALSPAQLQLATYKLCHLYYNWSGTTRVPAVCQYAKRLATLVATNLNSIPSSTFLDKTLYFL